MKILSQRQWKSEETFLINQMHLGIDARIFSSRFTGIGRYTYEISKRFFELRPDWSFTLFLNEKEYDLFTPPRKNIRKICAPERLYSIKEQITLPFRMFSQKCDTYFFPHFNVPIFFPKPFVTTIHDITISLFPGKKKTSFVHSLGYKLVFRNAVRCSKKIFTVSENTRNDLVVKKKVPPEKIVVAYNGVGEEFLHPSAPVDKQSVMQKFSLQSPYFLYTGVWRDHKNLLGLMEAFSSLLEKGVDVSLVITGNPDPYYPEVLKYISDHHLQDRIKTVGLVDDQDLISLYGSARAYIFPSFYEGFGMPPLEAMAMGIPVSASNTSCIPEICGNAARFFSPYDSAEMAKAMEEVFFDESLRESLIKNGKIRVQHFSWDTAACILLSEIEKEFLSANAL
jgi:glycosyltransferase involved in cell wall biosynthesis